MSSNDIKDNLDSLRRSVGKMKDSIDKLSLAQKLAERTGVSQADLLKLESGTLQNYFNRSADPYHAAGQRVMGPVIVIAGIGALTQGAGLLGTAFIAAGTAITAKGFFRQKANRALAEEIKQDIATGKNQPPSP